MIFLLLLILSANLYFAYKHFGTVIASPVLVGAGMCLATVNATLYYSEWEMSKMSIHTLIIIGGGTCFFTVFSRLFSEPKQYQRRIHRSHLNCAFLRWIE